MNQMRLLPFTSFVEAACTCLGQFSPTLADEHSIGDSRESAATYFCCVSHDRRLNRRGAKRLRRRQ
jgi:hypothetical protein